MSDLNWEFISSILRCPKCHHDSLDKQIDKINCQNCGSRYPIENGVIDLFCEKETPTPALYRNPYFQKFIAKIELLHNAHYAEGSLSNWIEQSIKADLFRLVDADDGVSIDLGCGLGEAFPRLGRPDRIVGVDSQMPLLQRTKSQYPPATLVHANLMSLPFRSGTLERVFAIGVLEHVFHIERMLEHVQRCLAPDGRFYVAIPTEGSLAVFTARLVTSARNSKLLGLTSAESRLAQRIDHCNSVHLLDNVIRKFFRIEATSLWPFRIGSVQVNLAKSYRLAHFEPG